MKLNKAKNIGVYIVNERGELLCHKRSKSLTKGGIVFPPGGAVETGETELQACIRETMEETDINISIYRITEFHREHDLACYYVLVKSNIPIPGPQRQHAWEMEADWGNLGNKTHRWIPLSRIQRNNEYDHLLRNIVNKLIDVINKVQLPTAETNQCGNPDSDT